jgi:inorganic phosphate transporter, PiT family
MLLAALLVLAAAFVAYANGANDNFKGVATLYGSGTTSFRTALWLGTAATLAGSISSVFLADELVKAFSGKGLVPDAVLASPQFLLAVALGAASTVMLATVLGFPISTTHALTGALVGAGFVAAGAALNLSKVGTAFFAPLLISPHLAVAITMPAYLAAKRARAALGVTSESCICLADGTMVPALPRSDCGPSSAKMQSSAIAAPSLPHLIVGTVGACRDQYQGTIVGVSAQQIANAVHYVAGSAVSFARGLNDTPKIVGLLVGLKALDIRVNMLVIAIAMAIGGLLNARKVAETMSKKISAMNDGQAVTATLVTACLVIGASRYGLPVSTTHVSVGAISGIGVVNGSADKRVIGSILLSWVLTLPIAAAIAATAYAVLKSID